MTTASLTPGLNHSHTRPTRPTTTPRSTTARTPGSVGQPIPPSHPNSAHTPSHLLPRSNSPNYFGHAPSPSHNCITTGGGHHARTNWSPPTSNVRSAAIASPRVVPLDQNPEFEEFRRQTEKMTGFASTGLSTFPMNASSRPSLPNVSSSGIASSPKSIPASPRTNVPTAEPSLLDVKRRSPKRLLSSPVPGLTDRPRRNSPAGFSEREANNAPQAVQFLPDDTHVRLSLPGTTKIVPSAFSGSRADTLPTSLNDQSGVDGGPAFVTPQSVVDALEQFEDDILILDLRVSTQYAASRIDGALNLCIPTTLLKRPSYNPSKLAETFKVDEQRRRFERWRTCKIIFVYDTNSSKFKDATPCVKMIEKFTNEGWSGASYIIRGGFMDFSRRFPSLISRGFAAPGGGPNTSGFHPSLPPVIGGCPMPETENAANPFFSNIRQNMDLIGGVGQIPLQHPSSMSKQQEEQLPMWLRLAVDAKNDGKLASEKFLKIEQMEQKRMQDALSNKVVQGSAEKPVQLAGIEKGQKNRYNNIWPYEHSRVKVQGVPSGNCDYFNANHIQSEWSNKRYIATQGPIPATFDDFWKVVWQQDVRVIVMLTAQQEGGQLKAHNYWDQRHYGPLRLEFLTERRASLEPARIHRHNDSRPGVGRRRSTNPQQGRPTPSQHNSELGSPTSDRPYVTVRRFMVHNSDEPFARMREVTQLQYSNWPDFGAPAHPTHLLGLVEQCDAVARASSGSVSSSSPEPVEATPILVHCSAGCGRTGTFCTVDSVIDMMKRQRREGNNNNVQRNTRQPTPMDIDPQSRSSSFAFPGVDSGTFFPKQTDDDQAWINDNTIDLIEKTVLDFRKQRLSMVQSLRQYVLCYESVLEWLCEQTPKSA